MASTTTGQDSDGSMQQQEDQQAQGMVLSLSHHLGPQGCRNSKVHLILASQSPRRREILDMMGLQGKFTPTPSPLDESELQVRLANESPIDYTRMLAEEKAKALAVEISDTITRPTLILGSDTIVDLDGKILEKPINEDDAKVMLTRLSGRRHAVHTGVAVHLVVPPPPTKATTENNIKNNSSNAESRIKLVDSFTDTALVCFAQLSEADIDAYIATKEPMDKAGSYGIQGIGGQFVSKVDGDFFTVMGLPMHRTSCALAQALSSLITK